MADWVGLGTDLFGAGKTLVDALHDVDLALVTWVMGMLGIELSQDAFNGLSWALLLVIILVLVYVVVRHFKHAAIISVIIVVGFLVLSFVPIFPGSVAPASFDGMTIPPPP